MTFTPAQDRVGQLVALGYEYKRIALILHIREETARMHVVHMARKLPNPDHLKPYTLVLLEFAHRRWRAERDAPTQAA